MRENIRKILYFVIFLFLCLNFNPVMGSSGIKLESPKNSLLEDPPKANIGDCLYYATLIGGSFFSEEPAEIDVDPEGCAYIVGETYSDLFPLLNPFDSVIEGYNEGVAVKLNADGSMNFSTFIGGNNSEYVQGVAYDSEGALFVAGYTYSQDFPTANAFNSTNSGNLDGFLTKFNADGSINFSTYFGGSNVDYILSVATDSEGACYVMGSTYSEDFPVYNGMDETYNGYCDVFVSKFNSNGTLNYSTFLGGSDYDYGRHIEISDEDFCYVIGITESNDFLTTINAYDKIIGGYRDAFITVLNSTGFVNYSTYFGGSSYDYGYELALGNDASFYISGYTYSLDFPLLNSYDSENENYGIDSFVAKFNPDKSLNFSTYFGGIQTDYTYELSVDSEGACYFSGRTNSLDFPNVSAYIPMRYEYDYYVYAFIASLSTNGSMRFSTYIDENPYNTYYVGVAADKSEAGIYYGLCGTINVEYYLPTSNFHLYSSDETGLLITKYIDPISDFDSDTLPNFWEFFYNLDMNDPSDATLNFDTDDLNNLEEFQAGTDPFNEDTDEDALRDDMELDLGTDPTNPDSDDDNLLDGDEVYLYGTDPNNNDTDGDGYDDGWEVEKGTNPNKAETPFQRFVKQYWVVLVVGGFIIAAIPGTIVFSYFMRKRDLKEDRKTDLLPRKSSTSPKNQDSSDYCCPYCGTGIMKMKGIQYCPECGKEL
jgi:hypothetical protein